MPVNKEKGPGENKDDDTDSIQKLEEYLASTMRPMPTNSVPARFDAPGLLTDEERASVEALRDRLVKQFGSSKAGIQLARQGLDPRRMEFYRREVEKGLYNEGLPGDGTPK